MWSQGLVELLVGVGVGVFVAFFLRLFGGKIVVPVSRLTASHLATADAEKRAAVAESQAERWQHAFEEQQRASNTYKEQRDALKQTQYINDEIMRAVREATSGGAHAQAQ